MHISLLFQKNPLWLSLFYHFRYVNLNAYSINICIILFLYIWLDDVSTIIQEKYEPVLESYTVIADGEQKQSNMN